MNIEAKITIFDHTIKLAPTGYRIEVDPNLTGLNADEMLILSDKIREFVLRCDTMLSVPYHNGHLIRQRGT